MKNPLLLYVRVLVFVCASTFSLTFANDCGSAVNLSLGVGSTIGMGGAGCDYDPPAQNLCATCNADAWFEFSPGGANNLTQYDISFNVVLNFTGTVNISLLYSESIDASGNPCQWGSNKPGYTQYTVYCSQNLTTGVPFELRYPAMDGTGTFFVLVERTTGTGGNVTVTPVQNGTCAAPSNDRCSSPITLTSGNGIDPNAATNPTTGSWIDGMAATNRCATKQRLQDVCSGGNTGSLPNSTEDHYAYKTVFVCNFNGNLGDNAGFPGPNQCQPFLENTTYYNFTVPLTSTDWYIHFGSESYCAHGPNNMMAILVQNINCNDADDATRIQCGTFNVSSSMPSADASFGPLSLNTGTTYTLILDGTRGSQCDVNILITRSPINPILPVEILRFEGYNEGRTNILVWETFNESDHSHFEVEKSTDGADYYSIGKLPAKGTGDGVADYQFADQNIETGSSFYRLKAVDINGNHFYSRVVEVVRKSDGLELLGIMPVPFKDELTLNFHTEYSGRLQIQLIDLTGRVFYTQSKELRAGVHNHTFSTDEIAAGIYLVKIQQGVKTVVKRVVKY
ncbi:MAG: T9SS type A sorting domain-containing protein [Bacteroidia bacterium]|nr:T9SS type A sorting domain-containing protein [Bacteroidia bacterium]